MTKEDAIELEAKHWAKLLMKLLEVKAITEGDLNSNRKRRTNGQRLLKSIRDWGECRVLTDRICALLDSLEGESP